MYFILGSKGKTLYDTFKMAFTVQQKHYPENVIIYSKNNMIEIVWTPQWETLDCSKL